MRRRLPAAALATALAIAACSGDDDGAPDSGLVPATVSTTTAAPTSSTAEGSPPPTGPRPLDQIDLRLVEVATFEEPIAWRLLPGDGEGAGSAFVAERTGRIRRVTDSAVVLDLSAQISNGSEQGLLGFAFSADGDRLFASYTDPTGTSIVEEFPFDPAEGADDDPEARRTILRIEQPAANHNGGDLHLGPDGALWLTMGDGGGAGDPQGNGQDKDSLLGKILRIDPDAPAGGKEYGIPADNPFAAGGGAPEVWLYGVRNPWRISFDPANGDLWVADVGQNQWEEVDLLPAGAGRGAGANLGWNLVEGTHTFRGPAPAGSVAPVYEYSHAEGCSITGGHVYRGPAIPALHGAYLFADYCEPGLHAIRSDGKVATEHREWPLDTGNTISFGVDAAGEVLVLTSAGPVYRIDPA